MKTIKIKDIHGNEVAIDFSREELRRIVSENKELLKESEVKGRYFFPIFGENYSCILNYEEISRTKNTDNIIDRHRIFTGQCYRTEEEAQLALDKQKAIVACLKWARENAPFEPDWGDDKIKFFVGYDHEDEEFFSTFDTIIQHQFTLPYFKSGKDTEAFIEACKEHLTLLFTK